MLELREDTASQVILLGPFIDDTDGKTPKTGLSIANTDIKLNKHGGTTLVNKNSVGATEISGGYYYCTLDATDTNTAGRLVLSVKMSGALIVFHEFMVRPTQLYDSMVLGTDALQVDVTQCGGSAVAAGAIPNAAAAANGGLPTVNASNYVAGIQGTVNNLNNLDAAVSTRAPESGGNIAAILADTGTDGVVVAAASKTGYSISGTKTTLDALNDVSAADVNAQCDQALADIDLDHLIQVSAGAEEPTDGSYLDQVMHKDAGQTFDATTDSLEAIRDKQTDIETDTQAIETDTAEIGAAGAGLTALAQASVCTEARLSELDAATGGKAANQIDLIKTEADKIALADAGAGVAGSVIEEIENRATPAQVNTEMDTVLKTDTVTLPGQGAPPASPTMEQALAWIYKTFRNKKTQTSTLWSLFNDAGDTVDSKATVSDGAGTATKEEIVSGP